MDIGAQHVVLVAVARLCRTSKLEAPFIHQLSGIPKKATPPPIVIRLQLTALKQVTVGLPVKEIDTSRQSIDITLALVT